MDKAFVHQSFILFLTNYVGSGLAKVSMDHKVVIRAPRPGVPKKFTRDLELCQSNHDLLNPIDMAFLLLSALDVGAFQSAQTSKSRKATASDRWALIRYCQAAGANKAASAVPTMTS